MPVELTFGAAIIVGLLGSSHCLGMCSGIAAALNMGVTDGPDPRPKSLLMYQLSYNGGRISSYVVVGLLAGTLGAGLMQLGISPVTGKLVAAGFMIALGLYLANWWRGLAVLEKLGHKLWRHIQPLSKRLFPIRTVFQAYLLGLLWGWLPCGLVYAVVAWSMTTGDAYDGATLMLGFGLGTLPAMLIAGKVFSFLKDWVKSPLVRTSAGVMIIAFGLYNGYTGFKSPPHHHHTDLSSTVLQQPDVPWMRVPAILRNMS